MPITQLEYEMKQSTMLRAASLDIKRDYEDIIYKLYDDDYKGDGDYKTNAGEWAMIISDLFTTKDIKKYTLMINIAQKKKINLWDYEPWIAQMKIQLPLQFRKRMTEFTQVPKLATMGTPPKRKKAAEYPIWSQ